MLKRIDELAIGDLVDLQGDTFADPTSSDVQFEFEYVEVQELDRETDNCIAVYFTDRAFGFPQGHVVKVAA